MNSIFKCWWCNSEGNSGEHKFKRTDLKYEFGDTFKDKDNYPVLIKEKNPEKQIKLQSDKSSLVKFKKIMCSKCNNERSKNFDKAYSYTLKHLILNPDKYLNQNFIDFRELYGNNWKINKLDFYSYFVKHICCRLASNDIEIPTNVINFLDRKTEYLEFINIEIQNKLDLKLLLELIKEEDGETGFLEIGKLKYFKKDKITEGYSYLTRKWIKTQIYFSDKITLEQFPDLKNFYQSPYIPYNQYSIIDINKNYNYNELKEEIAKAKKPSNEIESINNYFELNPYKIASS